MRRRVHGSRIEGAAEGGGLVDHDGVVRQQRGERAGDSFGGQRAAAGLEFAIEAWRFHDGGTEFLRQTRQRIGEVFLGAGQYMQHGVFRIGQR
ncbi:hypothetical protein D3C81_1659550 [compost metagenome]